MDVDLDRAYDLDLESLLASPLPVAKQHMASTIVVGMG